MLVAAILAADVSLGWAHCYSNVEKKKMEAKADYFTPCKFSCKGGLCPSYRNDLRYLPILRMVPLDVRSERRTFYNFPI